MSRQPSLAGAGERALLDRVRDRMVGGGQAATPGSVAAAVRAEVGVLGDVDLLEVTEYVQRELTGAGPLEPLLTEEGVTDVLVNGPDQVWVDRGGGPVPVPVRFPDDDAVRRLAQRLAAVAGRRLDEAMPYVDARLPGGVRLHAVLPPVAVDGTLLSLRVPARRQFTVDALVSVGSMTPPVAAVLRRLVRSRRAFLVTGGTGTGKTTVLAALLGLVPPTERVVVVEDSTELDPDHPHVVRLAARRPNVEGAGEIGLRDLVRQALRMRPDRIVVGEVRGAEVVDLLAALNTGHEGGCGTVHANAAADLPARVEALGLAAGLAREAVHSQLAAAIHAVVHLARAADGSRRVSEIGELHRDPSGLTTVRAVLDGDGRPMGRSRLLPALGLPATGR